MNILVTGNMGYIGPCLVDHLRSAYPEARLAGVDMGYFAHCLTTADGLPERRLDCQWFGDVREVPERVLQDVDTVVHLAAISNDPMGNSFEQVTHEVNHVASVALARRAKTMGAKRFVMASSCSMYGYAEGAPRREGDPLNPLTAYARSKAHTEQALAALADDGFIVTALRFATACGMSERLRLDLVLNDFVAGAIANREISILSDGTPWRPLIHIEDMARAIEWATRRGPAQGGAYLAINAGSDEWNYQILELAEACARALPGVRISVNPNAAPDKRSYRVDFGLYRKLAPRHQPQVDLAAAVRGLKEGLTRMNFRDKDFRNSCLIRLKTLGELRARGLLSESLRWTTAAAWPAVANA